jgi:FkbM family methyltransferase
MNKTIYIPKNNQVKGRFVVREGSSDIKSVDETWIKKAYQKPKLPFTINEGEKWLDLGANIGAFTCYAAIKGCHVRAYEPQADNCDMIRENIEINNVASRVEIIRAAIVPLSQHGKTLNFYESTNPASFRRHTLYGNYLNSSTKKNVKMTTVKALGFNTLIADGYNCIKMNIEGAEIPILNELETNIGIKKLVFEYSFDMDKRIKTYVEVIERLQTMFKVVKSSRTIPLHLEEFPFYPPNSYIFCSNE